MSDLLPPSVPVLSFLSPQAAAELRAWILQIFSGTPTTDAPTDAPPAPTNLKDFAPSEVEMISRALRNAGIYEYVADDDAFLAAFLSAVQSAPPPTGPTSIEELLSAAILSYSGGNGVQPFPALADAAAAIWTSVSAHVVP